MSKNNVNTSTITERFRMEMTQHGGQLPRKDVIKFLSMENAKILALMETEKFDLDNEKTQKEYLEFFDFFLQLYGEDKEMESIIFENWGGRLPLVLNIGANLMEAQIEFPYNQDIYLSAQQEKWKESFVDFILGLDADKSLSYFIGDTSTENSALQGFLFPKDIPAEDINDARTAIGDWFAYALQLGGGLVLRIIDNGTAGKDVINGFLFLNGTVRGVSEEEFERGHAMTFGDEYKPAADVEYRIPTWTAE